MRRKAFKRELVSGYQIHCQIDRDQTEYSDISDVAAVIFPDKMTSPVAFFKGHILHLTDMYESGENPAWICDGHSQSLSDLYCYLLFDDRPLEGAGLEYEGDIFHLERLWVDPAHRGQNLGLSCCAALLVLLQRDCAFAAMKPFPLQWEGRVKEDEAQFLKDRKKLMALYRPLEFIRVPKSDEYHYRPLSDGERILGFDCSAWTRVKKMKLPIEPENLGF